MNLNIHINIYVPICIYKYIDILGVDFCVSCACIYKQVCQCIPLW